MIVRSFREKVLRALAGDDVSPPDPDEPVRVVAVGRPEGQLLTATLERHGIPAYCVDATDRDGTRFQSLEFNLANPSQSTIWVRRCDVETALELINRYRA